MKIDLLIILFVFFLCFGCLESEETKALHAAQAEKVNAEISQMKNTFVYETQIQSLFYIYDISPKDSVNYIMDHPNSHFSPYIAKEMQIKAICYEDKTTNRRFLIIYEPKKIDETYTVQYSCQNGASSIYPCAELIDNLNEDQVRENCTSYGVLQV
jgi:hypothetical protein